MPYPEMMVAPMREDLVRIGFKEMTTPQEVDEILGSEKRTTLVAINSVCGCAAAMMRPAVAHSRLHHGFSPLLAVHRSLQGR